MNHLQTKLYKIRKRRHTFNREKQHFGFTKLVAQNVFDIPEKQRLEILYNWNNLATHSEKVLKGVIANHDLHEQVRNGLIILFVFFDFHEMVPFLLCDPVDFLVLQTVVLVDDCGQDVQCLFVLLVVHQNVWFYWQDSGLLYVGEGVSLWEIARATGLDVARRGLFVFSSVGFLGVIRVLAISWVTIHANI